VLGHFGSGTSAVEAGAGRHGRDCRRRGARGDDLVGVQNVLTKSLGSANPHNVIKATFDALIQLRDKAEVAALRGKHVEDL
jgi:small subunit ribosomal protein S5